jgi:hypothetical protein
MRVVQMKFIVRFKLDEDVKAMMVWWDLLTGVSVGCLPEHP